MGMVGNYKRLSSEQLQGLLDDPESVPEVAFDESAEADDPTTLYVDKAWHGIHFLLNGAPWSGEGPLFNAVLGGTEIGEDFGYGPARYLTPAEVKETAAALAELDDAQLRSRYSQEAFEAADIYPAIWAREGNEALDYVMSYLTGVRQFFLAAARAGDAMLLYMS